MRRMVVDHTLDEHALVDAWRTGDVEAMGMLYERYAPALRAYCAHRLGNRVDAEDAVHDTFLKAQLGMAGFQPQARLWPWLASIANHVCADMHRRRLRTLDVETMPGIARDIDEQVAARVRSAIVGDALNSLPPKYRVPVYLKHFVGSTYDEIARLQGRSVASVRSMLMRGRRNLGHRIEAVARTEKQWPLPIALPFTRRFRHRHGRGGIGIVARSMQQLAVIEASWLAAAALVAPAAAAVTVSLAAPSPASASAVAVTPPVGTRQPAPIWLPEAPAIALPTPDLPRVDTRHQYVRMSTDQADVPGDPPVEGDASLEKDEYHIRLRATVTGPDVPVWGPVFVDSATSWNCVKNTGVQGTACGVVIAAMEALPE